jgi:D-alanyl-D-alanine carboxypeptidase
MATYVKALIGGGLLDRQTQRIRMESIRPINPAKPNVG